MGKLMSWAFDMVGCRRALHVCQSGEGYVVVRIPGKAPLHDDQAISVLLSSESTALEGRSKSPKST